MNKSEVKHKIVADLYYHKSVLLGIELINERDFWESSDHETYMEMQREVSQLKQIIWKAIKLFEGEKPNPAKKLYLFNTTIALLPADKKDAEYSLKRVNLEEAIQLISDMQASNQPIISSIGHEPTAQILTELLQIEVKVNRINDFMQVGDQALCMKLKGRAKEGAILSRKEIEESGYEFILMTRTS